MASGAKAYGETGLPQMTLQPYVILGAGGFAREVYWHLLDIFLNLPGFVQNSPYLPDYFIFVDDTTSVQKLELGKEVFRVIKNWRFDDQYQFIVGVGSPRAKMTLVQKALDVGLRPALSVVHPRATVQDARMGLGGIITPGCVVTTNVTIGDYVVLNLNTTIGHDARIGDYCTINPGCCVSGNTTLGRGVTLGTGTVTRENASVAEGVTVGAQSAVIQDITEQDIVAMGTPARKFMQP